MFLFEMCCFRLVVECGIHKTELAESILKTRAFRLCKKAKRIILEVNWMCSGCLCNMKRIQEKAIFTEDAELYTPPILEIGTWLR